MNTLFAILSFLLGASLMSFSNLIVTRLIKKESLGGVSHCDYCDLKLRFIDVLPIFGYIINLGKCHNCKRKIPIKHLIIEIIGGFLFLISFLFLGEINLDLAIALIMITVLMAESLSDIYERIVFDRIWIIGLVIILIIRIIQNEILPYLLSSAILFALMFAFAWLGRLLFKKEAFGGGDIKLYIFIGFVLTYDLGLLSLFLAALLGLAYALLKKIKLQNELPFVPMISIAVYICYFFGHNILDWYLNLF
jgi:prepilin signal peptidase PulO-like enzyme (type II secretory pathway)